MDRGDIYLVDLDPTEGREQKGRRCVMIVSASRFNRHTGAPLCVPITGGGGFARATGFTVPLTGSGLSTDGVVRCDQARTLDLRARGARRLESAPDYIVNEVIARLSTLLE